MQTKIIMIDDIARSIKKHLHKRTAKYFQVST